MNFTPHLFHFPFAVAGERRGQLVRVDDVIRKKEIRSVRLSLKPTPKKDSVVDEGADKSHADGESICGFPVVFENRFRRNGGDGDLL